MECGFERGLICTVVFYNAEKDISCVVHGDDFIFEGGGPGLLWITEKMKGSWFEIKVTALLGPEEGDDKSIGLLGRQVRRTADGIE